MDGDRTELKAAPKPLPAHTELRAERVHARARMSDVSHVSGVPQCRVSMIERGLTVARPGEVERIREAIRQIARVLEAR